MNKQQNNKIINIQTHTFFSQDILNFKNYPDAEVAKYFAIKTPKYSILDLSSIKDTLLYDDIKDIFICIFTNNEPYTYKSKAFPYFFFLPEYMVENGYTDFSCIDDLMQEDIKWKDFLIKKGITYVKSLSHVISSSSFILLEYRDTREGLNRNYWRINDLHINKERLNKSSSSANISLNFWNIKDEVNREYCKVYFRYLLGSTELAYGTIWGYYGKIVLFINSINKTLLDVTHDDIVTYTASFKCKTDNNHNSQLNAIKYFFTYLSVKGIYKRKCPVTIEDYMANKIKYKKLAIPESTFLELFKHLNKLPDNLLLMFLIDAFTGLRISDICQITTDCLFTNEYGYYIAFNIQKTQDVGSIPISKELYDLIQDRINYINNLDYKETYLFPSSTRHNHPFNTQTYSKSMIKIISKWNVKTPDGQDYKFLTHAFRHTIATELHNSGMPSALIQTGVLIHAEITMSRSYIEIDENTHIRIQREKLGIKSNVNTKDVVPSDSILPNGYCGLPAKIHCSNLNACLECKFFRTNVQFLDIHKKQLEQLEKQLLYFEANSYLQNIAIVKKEIDTLKTIIIKLEEIKEDENE